MSSAYDPDRRRSKSFWRDQLDRAATVDGVVAVSRNYLADLAPTDLAMLPKECRPGSIKDDRDVQYWILALIETKCFESSDAQAAALFHEVVSIFALASFRISDIYKEMAVPMK
jgi:hypothetical protein